MLTVDSLLRSIDLRLAYPPVQKLIRLAEVKDAEKAVRISIRRKLERYRRRQKPVAKIRTKKQASKRSR